MQPFAMIRLLTKVESHHCDDRKIFEASNTCPKQEMVTEMITVTGEHRCA